MFLSDTQFTPGYLKRGEDNNMIIYKGQAQFFKEFGRTLNPGELLPDNDRVLKKYPIFFKDAMAVQRVEVEDIEIDNDNKDEVEIIMVRYNAPEIEEKCIEHVEKFTKHPYKLTIFNNYPKNEGLSTVWNRIIKKSKCKYVCLLNSDAFVTEGWLTEIMKGFDDDISAIGPGGDRVGGPQRGWSIEKAEANKGKFIEQDEISGFCMVIRKGVADFPEEVPFYGGEHAWCTLSRKAGYKILWSRGSFVEHLGEASGKKEGTNLTLRKRGIQEYAKWSAGQTPVLFTTYNRLDYTKQALKALKQSNCGEIMVVDNASTDGTQEWLKTQKGITVIQHEENLGVSGAMNTFFNRTELDEYVSKVDNDTIVPKDWLEKMILRCRILGIDVMQAKHSVLSAGNLSFDEWMAKLQKVSNDVFLSIHVGGSGVVVDRKKIKEPVDKSQWVLGGWTQFQNRHHNLKKAFCSAVEIELLDMKDDNEPDYRKYPEYYVKVGRAKIRGLKSERTLKDIKERLGSRFAYLRFGDGELMMMEDFKGHPHTQWTSPKFKEELIDSFKIDEDDYLIGSVAKMYHEAKAKPGLFAPFGNDEYLLNIVHKYYSDKTFYSPIALHYAYKFEESWMDSFFRALSPYKVVFVGGSHLKGIDCDEFVEIPSEQAYDTIDEWFPKVRAAAKRNDIMLISASMTANVIQKRLWKIRTKIGTIDLGSVANAITNYSGDKHTWIKK